MAESPLMEKVSSRPQAAETWSNIRSLPLARPTASAPSAVDAHAEADVAADGVAGAGEGDAVAVDGDAAAGGGLARDGEAGGDDDRCIYLYDTADVEDDDASGGGDRVAKGTGAGVVEIGDPVDDRRGGHAGALGVGAEALGAGEGGNGESKGGRGARQRREGE